MNTRSNSLMLLEFQLVTYTSKLNCKLMGWKAKSMLEMDLRGVPGWRMASDGREVSIVQHHRLLEMAVISGVIMGSVQNMEWWSLWKTRTS